MSGHRSVSVQTGALPSRGCQSTAQRHAWESFNIVNTDDLWRTSTKMAATIDESTANYRTMLRSGMETAEICSEGNMTKDGSVSFRGSSDGLEHRLGPLVVYGLDKPPACGQTLTEGRASSRASDGWHGQQRELLYI